MEKSKVLKYQAACGRGTDSEKVICILLTSPADVLEKMNNPILVALQAAGLSKAIGLYFYRFANQKSAFIKVGECTRPDGISKRFKNGWHSAESLTDSYWRKKKKGVYVDSEFLKQVRLISKENPAYFVFYQYRTISSHPKIDEIYAYKMHVRLYRKGTISPEKMNGNSMVGRKLVWHKKAFSEVARLKFPNDEDYPSVDNL